MILKFCLWRYSIIVTRISSLNTLFLFTAQFFSSYCIGENLLYSFFFFLKQFDILCLMTLFFPTLTVRNLVIFIIRRTDYILSSSPKWAYQKKIFLAICQGRQSAKKNYSSLLLVKSYVCFKEIVLYKLLEFLFIKVML